METAAEEGFKTLVYINAMPISIEDCAHHTIQPTDAKKEHNTITSSQKQLVVGG